MKYVSYGLRRLKNLVNINRIYTMWMRKRFRQLDSVLDYRVEIKNPQCISIGKNVQVQPYTWLCAMVNDLPRKNVFNPSIEVGNGTVIGRFAHITISNQLIIEENVLITEGVLISDTLHQYEDIHVPIIKQPMGSLGPIILGTGSWICNGARVFGKVRIGKHSVVGANTYVDKDVPDYCIVAGLPPRIIKRYDFEKNQWIKVNEKL